MFEFHQAKLTLKKKFVLIEEQRTSTKWDVGNSDIVPQLKVFLVCFFICFSFKFPNHISLKYDDSGKSSSFYKSN